MKSLNVRIVGLVCLVVIVFSLNPSDARVVRENDFINIDKVKTHIDNIVNLEDTTFDKIRKELESVEESLSDDLKTRFAFAENFNNVLLPLDKMAENAMVDLPNLFRSESGVIPISEIPERVRGLAKKWVNDIRIALEPTKETMLLALDDLIASFPQAEAIRTAIILHIDTMITEINSELDTIEELLRISD